MPSYEAFTGEIKAIAAKNAPEDWHLCDGTVLPLTQYMELFAVIGTTYGGDGTTNFALPNLQGRVQLGSGTGRGLSPRYRGELGGDEKVALTLGQMPLHSHPASALRKPGTNPSPYGAMLAAPTSAMTLYTTGGTDVVAAPGSVLGAGRGGAHTNLMPTIVLNYVIALRGLNPFSQGNDEEGED